MDICFHCHIARLDEYSLDYILKCSRQGKCNAFQEDVILAVSIEGIRILYQPIGQEQWLWSKVLPSHLVGYS